MSTMIKRGDILRATSGEHKGDYYLFARTCAGPNTNVVGQPINGTKNYAYNLFNLSNGKARQTESHKIFVSWRDGVNFTVGLPLIESHFGMTFELATDMVTVGPKITEAVAVQENQDENITLVKDFLKAMSEALGVGFVPAPAPKTYAHYVH